MLMPSKLICLFEKFSVTQVMMRILNNSFYRLQYRGYRNDSNNITPLTLTQNILQLVIARLTLGNILEASALTYLISLKAVSGKFLNILIKWE